MITYKGSVVRVLYVDHENMATIRKASGPLRVVSVHRLEGPLTELAQAIRDARAAAKRAESLVPR